MTPITDIKFAPVWHPEAVRSRLLCCVEYLRMHGLLTPGLYGALREDILCGRHEKQEDAQ